MGRAAIAALIALTGCMVSPADGYVVSSRDQRLSFSGYHPYPNAPVTLRAWSFANARWEEVATGRSSSTPIPATYWDDTLYSWSAGSRALPHSYWQAGRCAGYRARVKGETTVGGPTYGIYSSDLDAGDECSGVQNNSDWVTHCSSSESELRTRDFADAPRAWDIRFDGLPDANETCTDVIFTYSHAEGRWADVRGTYTVGRNSRPLYCAETNTVRGTTHGVCRLPQGSIDGVRATIESLQRYEARLDMSARDLGCAGGLRATTRRTIRPYIYTYGWERWSAHRDQCHAPPEPQPEPDPRSREVTCLCTSVGTATATLDACIDMSGGLEAVTRGASYLCGLAAFDLQRTTGRQTRCVLDAFGEAGAACASPGSYTITSVQ